MTKDEINELKCRVCGKLVTDSKNNNRARQKYCSFRCRMIGKRQILFGFSIFMAIFTIVFIILDLVFFPSIAPIIIACILFLFVISFTGFSYQFSHEDEEKRKSEVKTIITSNNKIQLREKIIEPLKMGKSKNAQICRICKLEITRSNSIYQCPQCNNYFHQQHLDDWLEKESTCPVCGFLLISKNQK